MLPIRLVEVSLPPMSNCLRMLSFSAMFSGASPLIRALSRSVRKSLRGL
jgi:hypothetical protein